MWASEAQRRHSDSRVHSDPATLPREVAFSFHPQSLCPFTLSHYILPEVWGRRKPKSVGLCSWQALLLPRWCRVSPDLPPGCECFFFISNFYITPCFISPSSIFRFPTFLNFGLYSWKTSGLEPCLPCWVKSIFMWPMPPSAIAWGNSNYPVQELFYIIQVTLSIDTLPRWGSKGGDSSWTASEADSAEHMSVPTFTELPIPQYPSVASLSQKPT